jgi:hypothetical protein
MGKKRLLIKKVTRSKSQKDIDVIFADKVERGRRTGAMMTQLLDVAVQNSAILLRGTANLNLMHMISFLSCQ